MYFNVNQSGPIIVTVCLNEEKRMLKEKRMYMKVLWVHWNVFWEAGYIKGISRYANRLFMMKFGSGCLFLSKWSLCNLVFIQGSL